MKNHFKNEALLMVGIPIAIVVVGMIAFMIWVQTS